MWTKNDQREQEEQDDISIRSSAFEVPVNRKGQKRMMEEARYRPRGHAIHSVRENKQSLYIMRLDLISLQYKLSYYSLSLFVLPSHCFALLMLLTVITI